MLHIDSDEDDQKYVLMNYEGNLLGKFSLPKMDEIQTILDDRIYTLHKNPDVGDTIRIYRLF